MTKSAVRPAVVVLLLLAIVVPLLVGIYDRETPTFLGFPFFFWFQFLLIPVVSLCTWAAYLLLRRERPEAPHDDSRETP